MLRTGLERRLPVRRRLPLRFSFERMTGAAGIVALAMLTAGWLVPNVAMSTGDTESAARAAAGGGSGGISAVSRDIRVRRLRRRCLHASQHRLDQERSWCSRPHRYAREGLRLDRQAVQEPDLLRAARHFLGKCDAVRRHGGLHARQGDRSVRTLRQHSTARSMASLCRRRAQSGTCSSTWNSATVTTW